MNLKLMKISPKSFILIFSTINAITGFIIGAIVTTFSVLTADAQNPPAIGAWSIVIFPIVNGIFGIVGGALLTGLFNFFSKRFGGLKLEFESEAS